MYVYSMCRVWLPLSPSSKGDCTLRVWDMHIPTPCVCAVPAHEADVLTCDWNKYNEVHVTQSSCWCVCVCGVCVCVCVCVHMCLSVLVVSVCVFSVSASTCCL